MIKVSRRSIQFFRQFLASKNRFQKLFCASRKDILASQNFSLREFPFHIFRIFIYCIYIYILYLCHPSEGRPRCCTIPDDNSPWNSKSLPSSVEGLDTNLWLLHYSQFHYHAPPIREVYLRKELPALATACLQYFLHNIILGFFSSKMQRQVAEVCWWGRNIWLVGLVMPSSDWLDK